MTPLHKIIEKAEKEFEKEFVNRPFEPDGDWSWKMTTSPYPLKSFLALKIEEAWDLGYEAGQRLLASENKPSANLKLATKNGKKR